MKQKKEVISTRLSTESLKKLDVVAKKQHIPIRTLIRSWVMQRLDKEDETSVPSVLADIGTGARTEPAIKEVCPNA